MFEEDRATKEDVDDAHGAHWRRIRGPYELWNGGKWTRSNGRTLNPTIPTPKIGIRNRPVAQKRGHQTARPAKISVTRLNRPKLILPPPPCQPVRCSTLQIRLVCPNISLLNSQRRAVGHMGPSTGPPPGRPRPAVAGPGARTELEEISQLASVSIRAAFPAQS